ncbi:MULTISPECIES: Crp/Fnr family transcriptional regulator [Acetobacter]|uniref:Crp/Fnr family transcriptional regulator n=1 Tax=Acetobacter TaxID=434 RepID=UPI00376FD845
MSIGEYLPPEIKKASVVRKLQRGDFLFQRNTPAIGVYEVLEGRVSMSRLDPVGRDVILFVATPGETLAEATIFGGNYHCNAVALTQAIVRLYPQPLLLQEYEQNQQFAIAYTRMLARQLVSARARIEQRNMQSARDRLRHFLSLNMDPERLSVKVRGTLKELAGELGLTHESLYRALARMEEEGEIYRQNNEIMVRPPAGMSSGSTEED